MSRGPLSPMPKSAAANARQLAHAFAGRGFELIDPPVLLPAEIFVELSGEDIRRRLFLVTDPSGEELCLRPDFTLPVARHYLDQAGTGEQRYTYSGPAFRCLRAEAGPVARREFYQTGMEIFGARDAAAAELEVIELTIAGVRALGLDQFALRLGDPGLFNALLNELRLPDAVQRRLRRHFWRHDLPQDLAGAVRGNGTGGQEALAAALAGLDRAAAAQLVEEVFALAGIVPVGGRSAEEIVMRFMERADASTEALSPDIADLIRAFLEIEGEPLEAHGRMVSLLRDTAPGLGAQLDALGERLETIRERLAGAGDIAISFDAEFGRRLEYYTGLVFEIIDPDNPELEQIAGGGRYDDLLGQLGAVTTIPAVGAAVYVDRLLAATRERAGRGGS